MKNDLTTTIQVSVSAKEAFDKISRVGDWWATNITGSTKNLSDVFNVRFGKTFSTIQITELIIDKKIVWSVIDSSLPLFNNPQVWKDTQIVWEILNENKVTQIKMTHIGLTPENECYPDCKKGWSFYVQQSLAKLISEGKGFPGTGIFANISNGGSRYEGLLYFKNDPLPDFADDLFFIDLRETKGEEVTKAYSADVYCEEKFNPQQLKGDYFMIIQNSPLYNNLSPMDDILEIIQSQYLNI